MTESAIVFEGVSKVFGKVRALDRVNLNIENGSIYCLLGVNGAGKSTALRLLLNRMLPTSGQIQVLGKSASRLGSEDFCRIAYVSESQRLYEWMTLEDTLKSLKIMYPTWDDGYCAKLIELFRLPLDRKVKTLSRGMKMKAKMLFAFSFHPKVVVMDEPFTGLDPIVREECIEGLVNWANEGERTMVISSHDVDDVEPICDRVGILHEGTVILDEPLDSLKARMRKVSFHCDDGLRGELPENWIQVERNGRSHEFVDTKYDTETSSARLQALYPEAKDVSFRPMSLRELFVSKVKNVENQGG